MSTELPLVSIIAICYNQSKYIVETLDSIKDQSYTDIELIIVDDCSTDDSVEVIENWLAENGYEACFIKHSKNTGVSRTCNDGLDAVKGKYYQIIACDDALKPDKISKQVRWLEEDASLGAVFANCTLIDEHSKAYGDFFSNYIKHEQVDYALTIEFNAILKKNYLHPVSGLIRTHIAKEIGKYDERLFVEDWDFSIRLALNTKVLLLKECFAYYRVINTSLNHLPKNRFLAIESAILSLLKYRGKGEDLIIKNQVLALSFELYKIKAPAYKKWLVKTFLMYPGRITLSSLKLVLRT